MKSLFLILSIFALLSACNNAKRGKSQEPDAATLAVKPNDLKEPSAEALKKLKQGELASKRVEEAPANPGRERKEVTLAEYETFLLGLEACKVGQYGIDRKCEAWKAFDKARKHSRTLLKTAGGALASLGRKHIGHKSPAVRLQSSQLMSSIFGATDESQKVIIAAAKDEKDPMVLKQLIRTVASSIKKSDEVRKMLLASTQHKNLKVRIQVVSALTASWAAGTEGTLEAAIKMIEEDPKEEVRAYACKYIGARADERALPILKKYTKESKSNPKMYAACLRGLIGMWSSPIPHKTPSKKAYKLTLDRLKQKPRVKEIWTVISGLDWAKKAEFQKQASWYKAEKVRKILKDIILDKKFYWLGRSGAASTFQKLGADKAALEAVKKKIGEPEGDDKHVIRKLDDLIAKSK